MPHLEDQSVASSMKGYQKPFGLLIITVISLFLAEVLIMIFISLSMPPLPLLLEAIFDALILTTMCFPVLYFSLFRPMNLHITGRKHAEETAKLAYAELNQVFQTAADGMRVIDKDYNTLRVNETFANLSGIDKQEAVGKKCYEVFPGPQCHTPICSLKRIFSGEERVEFEAIKKRRDGTEVPCIVTATPFRRSDGKLIGIVEDFKDITERKRAEEALQKHHDHLEELVEKRTRKLSEVQQGLIMAEKHVGLGRLAAGIAHEIKNQLTPVLTEAQRILSMIESGKELSTQYMMERARTIEEASRTANKITMAMLDYARESKPEFSHYNLRDSIESVVALHQSDCKRVNVLISVEEIEVEEIFADKRQIEQVLINIINNGCESILEKKKGGIITISVNKKDPYAVISIQDTGTGIREEIQGKIFDPFFTTKAPRGVGLGLSVSYGIIERHGGKIDFESELGVGTTFRVYLPIK
ncbi:MAG: ATP-binding protein [Nitrospirota bacterium]